LLDQGIDTRSLSAEDDRAVHRGTSEQCWETWRYGVFAPDAGVTAVVKLQAGPRDGDASFSFSAFEGERALCMESGTALPFTEDGDARSVGPLSLRCVAPNETWQIDVASGEVEAHLTWRAMADPYAWPWPEWLDANHHEHGGTIEGTLRVGDRTIDIAGFAQRERTWGLTRSSISGHGWSSRVFFGPDLYTHQAIVTIGRRDYLFGYAHADGVTAGAHILDVTIANAHPGGPPLTGTAKLSDDAGRSFDYRYEGGAAVPSLSPSGGGFVARSYGFPRFTFGERSAIGQIDYWYTDQSLVRPHLAAMTVGDPE
jgi:hypothetical protein